MRRKTYGKPNGEGYTAEELMRNLHCVTTDIECPHCGKWQPLCGTHYDGGPCCKCGKLTGDKPDEP